MTARRAVLAAAAAVLLLVGVLVLTGCAAVSAPTFTAHTAPTPAAPHGDAAVALAALPARPGGDRPGYDRDAFPHWTDPDRDGCDGRETAIARAAGARTGCPAAVVSVPDAYLGRPVLVRDAEGDHVWPLHAAWNAGADRWTHRQRETFANDPLNVAITYASVNRRKSDRMPDTWRTPDAAAECGYVARVVAVGVKYRLAVTAGERAAMGRELRRCPPR